MFTEIKEGKRVLTKDIKLDTDLRDVLLEYHFKENPKDFFSLPNPKNIRIEVIVMRDNNNHIESINLKIIGEVKEFLFFKTVKNTWTLQDQSGWESLDSDGQVVIEIMNKVREFWEWYRII
jgi:hypothetical protein